MIRGDTPSRVVIVRNRLYTVIEDGKNTVDVPTSPISDLLTTC